MLVLNGQSSNAVARRFTWGLDLSGQQSRDRQGAEGIHGAGGIGGLLATAETGGMHQGTYWYLYDGRGNVVTVLSAAPGYALKAYYEYTAFGTTSFQNGSYCLANPFRFSTKWADGEIGLYDYGYRYYNPRLGRWVSRDPIEEVDGPHLYLFVQYRPTDFVVDGTTQLWVLLDGLGVHGATGKLVARDAGAVPNGAIAGSPLPVKHCP